MEKIIKEEFEKYLEEQFKLRIQNSGYDLIDLDNTPREEYSNYINKDNPVTILKFSVEIPGMYIDSITQERINSIIDNVQDLFWIGDKKIYIDKKGNIISQTGFIDLINKKENIIKTNIITNVPDARIKNIEGAYSVLLRYKNNFDRFTTHVYLPFGFYHIVMNGGKSPFITKNFKNTKCINHKPVLTEKNNLVIVTKKKQYGITSISEETLNDFAVTKIFFAFGVAIKDYSKITM